jgi:hypothetical protein
MKATFLKGVVLGSAVSITALAATAAFAGTGMGKVFNLGEDNRVNVRSQLEGTAPSALLNVTNANGSASASGISIDVPASNPPLVVNSATKVKNLNADLLDGRNSSTFQGAISTACPNGTAISSITPTGVAACNSSVVLPIDTQAAPGAHQVVAFPPSSLSVTFACSADGMNSTMSFANQSAAPATVSYDNSVSGSMSPPDLGVLDINSGATGPPFQALSTDFAGQMIYFDITSVSTVNLHVQNLGMDGCEYRGTVEEALR